MITEIAAADAPEMPGNENHLYYSWNDEVYFSATKHGEALSIHIAADRRGKRGLRRALNEFCEWLFQHYAWCKVIIGMVGPQSIVNLGLKCGFEIAARQGPATIMVRERK